MQRKIMEKLTTNQFFCWFYLNCILDGVVWDCLGVKPCIEFNEAEYWKNGCRLLTNMDFIENKILALKRMDKASETEVIN